jgi:Sulfotransferase domain
MVQAERGLDAASSEAMFEVFLERFRDKHKDVYVILGPPRCSSTAFARVFWEHPSIGFYSHEPFDVLYHRHLGLSGVSKAMERPLYLEGLKNIGYLRKELAFPLGLDFRLVLSIAKQPRITSSLVIKEMTFQVGSNFRFLASTTKNPIIFVIRDPRLSIASRMRKRAEGGDNPIFPLVESGWDDLKSQFALCKQANLAYIIVDSTDFRNHSQIIFKKTFKRLGLSFSKKMLSWRSKVEIGLGQLGGDQYHWYERVLKSTGLQPACETIPKIADFPQAGGFRDHVENCLQVYDALRKDANMVLP